MALINCPECSAEISDKSISCVKCGYPIASPITPIPVNPNYLIEPQKNPGLAAVLSLIFPGLGQIYNGEIGFGLFMMVLTIFLYFIVIGFFVHIWLIFNAYNYAEELNQKLRSRNTPLDVDFDPQLDKEIKKALKKAEYFQKKR
jgi:TM2 domain-containing membrane protein YozV